MKKQNPLRNKFITKIGKEETKIFDEIIDESPLQRAIRKANELKGKRRDQTHKRTAAQLSKIPIPLESNISEQENEDENISLDYNELKVKHNQNLKDLVTLTNHLKNSYGQLRDDLEDENEDDLARATNQDFDSSQV